MLNKMVRWFCSDCRQVLEKPIMCVGNHSCMKCENCRGTSIEIVRDNQADA